MADFSKYVPFDWTFSLICYMLSISSPADGKNISEVVGSRVILHCPNNSISTLVQLTWTMNNVALFSLNVKMNRSHVDPKASRLNINMSQSEDQLHELIIERAQKLHTGNYTCETTSTDNGVQSKKWELTIKEPSVGGETWPKLIVVVATAVPCVCLLIFIIVLAILHRVCKRRTENDIQPPTAETEKPEEIYENCLEAVRERNYIQPH